MSKKIGKKRVVSRQELDYDYYYGYDEHDDDELVYACEDCKKGGKDYDENLMKCNSCKKNICDNCISYKACNICKNYTCRSCTNYCAVCFKQYCNKCIKKNILQCNDCNDIYCTGCIFTEHEPTCEPCTDKKEDKFKKQIQELRKFKRKFIENILSKQIHIYMQPFM